MFGAGPGHTVNLQVCPPTASPSPLTSVPPRSTIYDLTTGIPAPHEDECLGLDLDTLLTYRFVPQQPLLPRSHQFRPDLRSMTSRQGFRRLTRMNVWGWTWTHC